MFKGFYFDSNENRNKYGLIFSLIKLKFALKSAVLILNSIKILDKNALYIYVLYVVLNNWYNLKSIINSYIILIITLNFTKFNYKIKQSNLQ